jgi:hypothetical protein
MFPFQLGDFALPEIAVWELRMRNRQVRLPHRFVAIPYDIEVERSRSPADIPPPPPLPAALRFDATAVFQ